MSALIAKNPDAFAPDVVIEAPHGMDVHPDEDRLREAGVDFARRRTSANGGAVLLLCAGDKTYSSVDHYLTARV